MDWRVYGAAVLVSAGIVIDGTLWFSRKGGHLRGEDTAELLAARNERRAYAFAQGAEPPAWPASSNEVWCAPLWSDIYTEILSGSRALSQTEGQILFMDATMPLPADGDWWVGYSGAGWTNHLTETNSHAGDSSPQIVRHWSLSAATSRSDMQHAAASRAATSGVRMWPGVAPSNTPLHAHLYGGQAPGGIGAAWPGGNWWTRIGMGTNVYLYACERVKLGIGGAADILAHSGSGYSADPVALSFTAEDYAEPQGVVLTETSGSGVGGARVYEARAAGCRSGYFGAADAWGTFSPGGWSPANVPHLSLTSGGSEKTAFVIPDGGASLTLYVSVILSGGGNQTVDLTYGGGASGPASVTWSASAPPFDASFDITCADGAAGTIHVQHRSAPAREWTALVVNPPDDGGDFAITPPSAEVTAGATALFNIALRPAASNFTAQTDRLITSNNLDQARVVLTNLTRTAAVYTTASLTVSNAVRRAGTYTADWSQSLPKVPDRPEWDPYARFAAMLWTDLPDLTATTEAWDGSTLSSYTATLDRWDLGLWYDADADYRWHWYATYDSSATVWELQGCSLPYPSQAACAAGLVRSVRVYAAVYDGSDGLTTRAAVDLPETADYSDVTDFTVDGVVPAPTANDNVTLGACGAVTPLPAAGFSPVYTETREDVFSFPDADAAFAATGVRLTLVAQFDSPASVPVFTLGSAALSVPASAPDCPRSHCALASGDGYGDPQNYDERWLIAFGRSVCVSRLIVVVDWDWDHMNPARPYEPAPHTPAWTIKPAE